MDLHAVLTEVIPTLASLIEGIGVLIILYGCVKSLYLFILDRLNLSNNQPKLELAKALAYQSGVQTGRGNIEDGHHPDDR